MPDRDIPLSARLFAVILLPVALGWPFAGTGAVQEVPAETEAGAEADPVTAQDADIRERLMERYARIEALDGIEVDVAGGVVRLRGQVQSERHQSLAETLARRTDGAIEVDNALTLDTRLGVRLAPVVDEAGERMMQLVAALPLLLLAAAIVALAAWSGRWLSARDRLFRRVSRNPFLSSLLRQAVRMAAVLVGVLVALDLLNATALVGAILGTAGVVGLALGFAFRDVIENYIAGILLSLRQPFAPNDHVVIDGHEGKVAALTSRATILLTPDGNHLRLPNALVFKGVMLNYTRNPTRRFHFDVGVDPDVDLAAAQRAGVQALGAMTAVLDNPPPQGLLRELGDSTVTLRFSAWIDQREVSFIKVASEAMRTVKEALDRAGIPMPAPAYRIEMASAGERPEPDRPAAPAVTGDVAPETYVDAEIDREREAHGRDNLLDPNAPQE